MTLRRLAPIPAELEPAELLERLGPVLPPFDPEIEAFGARLSARLFADPAARAFPDLASLAFWLRPAATATLRAHVAGLGEHRVPRGLVLHVAPANVDTLFVYSWWLSAVVGNRAIVRLSERAGARTALLLRLISETLAEPGFARLAAATAMVSYPRDDATSHALSLAADLRVIWGGDATVDAFRALPLRPGATELIFPDRRSLAVIMAAETLALDEAGRDDLAERFYRDCFWFDQKACSSPLLLAWVGDAASCERAAADFWPRLAGWAERQGYAAAPATQMAKLTEAARLVLDGAATTVTRHGAAVVVARGGVAPPRLATCGGGLFQETILAGLDEVARLVDPRIQTLTQFGLSEDAGATLAGWLSGKGAGRLVPVGRALDFRHIWDGQDLLAAMTRNGRAINEGASSPHGV